jgi:hypothetical protein
MSMLPSIAASGLGLLARGEERLARSAATFTRSAEPSDPSAADPAASAATPSATEGADLVDAALGVVYGRSAFEIGVRLIAVGRDTEQQLVDVLA